MLRCTKERIENKNPSHVTVEIFHDFVADVKFTENRSRPMPKPCVYAYYADAEYYYCENVSQKRVSYDENVVW